jgi:hypothetical protein
VMKRIEGGEQPGADRRRAGGRELLAPAHSRQSRLRAGAAEAVGLVGDRLELRSFRISCSAAKIGSGYGGSGSLFVVTSG